MEIIIIIMEKKKKKQERKMKKKIMLLLKIKKKKIIIQKMYIYPLTQLEELYMSIQLMLIEILIYFLKKIIKVDKQ